VGEKVILWLQSEGPHWDELPEYYRAVGEPGIRLIHEKTDHVGIAAYDEEHALVGVLDFSLNFKYAQPIEQVWLITRPDARRRGWATRLYKFAQSCGFDMEAASDGSLINGLLTPDGYDFMVGRRRKSPALKPKVKIQQRTKL